MVYIYIYIWAQDTTHIRELVSRSRKRGGIEDGAMMMMMTTTTIRENKRKEEERKNVGCSMEITRGCALEKKGTTFSATYKSSRDDGGP